MSYSYDVPPRFEVRDHRGNFIHRYANWIEAKNYAADATHGLNRGYFTLWFVNDFGCANDLIGHGAHGDFHLRPCMVKS